MSLYHSGGVLVLNQLCYQPCLYLYDASNLNTTTVMCFTHVHNVYVIDWLHSFIRSFLTKYIVKYFVQILKYHTKRLIESRCHKLVFWLLYGDVWVYGIQIEQILWQNDKKTQSRSQIQKGFNSLWPNDTIWHLRSWSTLVQVMAGCPTASTH